MDDGAALTLRERKRARTRAAIYEAAMELFEERPYAEVTVEDICERAEIGRATFFRFYGAKGALLLEFNRRLADRARAAIDAGAQSAEKLRTVAAVIADAWADSSAAMRAMAFDMLNRPETPVGGETLHPELIALVAEVIAEGQRNGDLRGAQLGAEFIATMVVTVLAGCVANWFDTPDIDLRAAAGHTVELMLTGLQD
ncbi:helix-turn-helix domain-containing protein [Mycobacterium sp. ACS4331]|uniref:TetR/AcrR family transcriptional regulator n=1 Tax=Mycobacterium sp. ACS4331 TaxID=1834121 RepID=UPI0007FBAB4C|nr:helix-turn-helix domain-containing protein [Mycobacterium sp. ACS4331]OBF30116.1 TetR family transcriptional regulator [Mycobacterium sp. ACS4331]